jgi:hypothetical protein
MNAKRVALRVSSRASLPTLDEIKLVLGIDPSDDSKDAAIAAQLAAVVTMIENYLQRGIAFAHEIEEFDPPETRVDSLNLFRFPVSAVQSVTQEGTEIAGYRFAKKAGIVYWRRGCYRLRSHTWIELPLIVVEYDGGYPDDAWPADLLGAVMQVFYARWAATGGTGSVSNIDAGASANRSVSVDGLTITRGEGPQSTYAFGGVVIPVNVELAPVAAVLEPYRARPVGGV